MSPEQSYDEPDNSGKTSDRLLSELRELREAGAKSKGFAEALSESEEKFRALTETSPAMVLFHQGGKFLYANPASEKITGYTHDELLNMDFWRIISPDYREVVKERGLARLKGENPIAHYPIKILTKQGEEKWLYLSSARMIYRGKTAIMVNAMDITKRKRAEEALRESEGRLRAIFDQAAMGIGIADRDGRILDCNNAFQAMLGYGKQELLQRHFAEITYPDDVEKNVDQFKRTVAGQIDKYQMEKRYVRKDGSLIWCLLNSSVIRDENGDFKYSLAIIDDITESKRLKEKLAHAASFPELNPNPILEVDVAGAITYMNPAASQLFPDLRSRGMGHPMLEGIPPGIFNKGEKTELTREVQVNDTTYHQIIHFLPDRRTARIYSTDITKSKRAEKALRLAQFSINSASDEIFMIEPDGRIFSVNESACSALGYSRDELVTLYVWDVDPDFSKAAWPAHWQKLKGLRALSYESSQRTKDGRAFPTEVTANYLEFEGREYNCAIVRDITGRKRAEKALRDGQARLNSIFRAAPTGIGVVVDRVITEANDRLCEMTGHTREELLGKNARILYPSDEDYEYVGREKYDQISRSGTGAVETRWRCKDGAVINILLSSTPMDPDDLHAGVTFTALDITERKRDEKELIYAKEQAELYLDLMGHDINNIHQAALGYLELARDMPGDSREEYLDKATEALKRSAQLIQNVRKLQKFQDSKAWAHDMDLCAVLSGVLEEYANAPGKALTLELGGRTHCRARADDLLHDVFSNLVSNAVKHTGDRASIAISLDMARKDGRKYCRVLVEDDGPGIPDEAKRTLFNRSLRGTSRAKGMGLGLYIVKTLVEKYGGLVWAEDRIKGDHSKGVRFVVMLPAVE